jgi:hypothetical protein
MRASYSITALALMLACIGCRSSRDGGIEDLKLAADASRWFQLEVHQAEFMLKSDASLPWMVTAQGLVTGDHLRVTTAGDSKSRTVSIGTSRGFGSTVIELKIHRQASVSALPSVLVKAAAHWDQVIGDQDSEAIEISNGHFQMSREAPYQVFFFFMATVRCVPSGPVGVAFPILGMFELGE